jgi:hypothetical protein
MIIRKRSVYDIVTLIAEVSGFADMFVVSASALLGIFYQPVMLESALLQYMTTYIRKRNAKTKDKNFIEGIHERKRTKIDKALF